MLTDRQANIVAMVAQGLTRMEIAVNLDISDTIVRKEIRRLCERYHCPTSELPQKTRGEKVGA